jgi:Zn-finger nucleic acid-binding protein
LNWKDGRTEDQICSSVLPSFQFNPNDAMSSADLTGRAGGYRGLAIRCPGCAAAMRQLALSEAEVDVCDACGGIWVDWFDGEVKAIAAETLHVNEPVAPGGKGRNEAVAAGACPRCTRQIVPERYAIGAQGAAELLRCEECLGVFVTRTSAEQLASLAESEQLTPPAESRAIDPVGWQRFIALLKSLFGLA